MIRVGADKGRKSLGAPVVAAIMVVAMILGSCFSGCGVQSPVSSESTEANRPDQSAGVATVVEQGVGSVSACLAESETFVDDPSTDGWDTEVFGNAAGKQIKNLFERQLAANVAVAKQPKVSGESDGSGAAGSMSIRPAEFTEEFAKGKIVVRIWRPGDNATQAKGNLPLAQSLESLKTLYADVADPHVKVKVTRVTLDDNDASAKVLLAIDGHSEKQRIQSNATLRCEFVRKESDGATASSAPQLSAISVEKYQEAVMDAPHWFREYTPSLMKGVPAYEQQLAYSCDYWSKRVERRLGANFLGYQGVSVGDVNGDLRDDVYLCQGGGTPNLLLVQQEDGTLKDISSQAGVDFLDSCRCALFLDLDNDGDQDLVVASITGVLFLENDGQALFTLKSRFAGARLGYTLTAADYDSDGDVDIYACCYHPPADAEFANPIPYHDANNGSPNFLLSNNGDWTFSDVTSSVGLEKDNTRWTYSAGWQDYDNDGDPDLYTANDFGRNCLYRNDGGKFKNVAAEAGVEDTASGMSVSWSDYDRDGQFDLYVSNMFSSAGGRIAFQQQFQPTAGKETRKKIQRLARGNSLFRNNGDGTFADVTVDAGVEMGRWAWSSNFVDLNNDGLDDIMVANGNYTGDDSGDL